MALVALISLSFFLSIYTQLRSIEQPNFLLSALCLPLYLLCWGTCGFCRRFAYIYCAYTNRGEIYLFIMLRTVPNALRFASLKSCLRDEETRGGLSQRSAYSKWRRSSRGVPRARKWPQQAKPP
ncbi:hypothetical protein GGS21DRAFT_112726 [Xylaria nigripes]|nr:hypothetical protein GGS21DRAFT_112726 [Xylaria nigripes]